MTIKSDRKPLEMIFKKELISSPMWLQRMMLQLQNFAIDVQYKKGKLMYLADMLSWAYLQQEYHMSVKCWEASCTSCNTRQAIKASENYEDW